jgi:hypothetical protein
VFDPAIDRHVAAGVADVAGRGAEVSDGPPEPIAQLAGVRIILGDQGRDAVEIAIGTGAEEHGTIGLLAAEKVVRRAIDE